MTEKVKINYAGQECLATPVDISQSSEQWNQYLLDDGTVIRMKLVATKAYRVDGRLDEDGNPVYLVKSTNIMSVNAPESLKNK